MTQIEVSREKRTMWVGVGRVGVLSLFSAFFSLLSIARHSPLSERLNQRRLASLVTNVWPFATRDSQM